MTSKTTAWKPDQYLQVVSMSALGAKAFAERNDDPVDLGPADPARYKPGARVWGFAMLAPAGPLDRLTAPRSLAHASPVDACPSRHYAYECSLPAGHHGLHATDGGFTTWPDSADTRVTVLTHG